MKHRALLLNVLHALVLASSLLAELHDGADILGGHHDLRLHHGLLHVLDLRGIRQVGRIGQFNDFAACLMHFIDNARSCGHQVQVVLSLQSLLDDLQVEKPKEAAPETKAKGNRRLRLKLQRCIIKLEFFQRVPKVRVFRPVSGVHAAIYHGLHFFVAGKRLAAGMFRICHRVTHPGILYILKAGCKIAHHAGFQLLAGDELPCSEIAHFHHFCLGACRHHKDRCSLADGSFHDSAEDNDAFVGVVQGVKDQRLQGRFCIPRRSRDLLHDLLQHLVHIQPCFRRDERRILCLYADDVLDLLNDSLRLCTWQVHLVDDRHHVQIVIQGQVHICQRLGLHALGRIHYKDGSVTGSQTPGYLVVKIHMPRGIDKVKNVFVAILCFVDGTDSLGFDGDPSLPFQIHIVQHLGLHLTAGEQSGHLDDPVRQGGFTVVNMGDNTKITNSALFYCSHFYRSFHSK